MSILGGVTSVTAIVMFVLVRYKTNQEIDYDFSYSKKSCKYLTLSGTISIGHPK